jgi:hypothetical protein
MDILTERAMPVVAVVLIDPPLPVARWRSGYSLSARPSRCPRAPAQWASLAPSRSTLAPRSAPATRASSSLAGMSVRPVSVCLSVCLSVSVVCACTHTYDAWRPKQELMAQWQSGTVGGQRRLHFLTSFVCRSCRAPVCVCAHRGSMCVLQRNAVLQL